MRTRTLYLYIISCAPPHSLPNAFRPFRVPCGFPAGFPPLCRHFALTLIKQTAKIGLFLKKNTKTFCQFAEKVYLCTRFPKNMGNQPPMKQGKAKLEERVL